jgi:hypothetical protein
MAESATSVGSLAFFGLFAIFSPRPSFYFTRPESLANVPRKLETGPNAPRTFYWLGGPNEMAAINTILIIVNSAAA